MQGILFTMFLGNKAPAAVLLHRKPTFSGNLQSVSSAVQLTFLITEDMKCQTLVSKQTLQGLKILDI
jgi:hypothetical protein